MVVEVEVHHIQLLVVLLVALTLPPMELGKVVRLIRGPLVEAHLILRRWVDHPIRLLQQVALRLTPQQQLVVDPVRTLQR